MVLLEISKKMEGVLLPIRAEAWIYIDVDSNKSLPHYSLGDMTISKHSTS